MASGFASLPRLSRRAPVYLGIDLGERRTKLVGLSHGPEGLSLIFSADEISPPGLFVNGRLAAVEDGARHVAEILSARKIRDRRTAIAVSQHDCAVRRVEVPRLSAEGVVKALRVNPTLKVGDTPGNNLAVDYHELMAWAPAHSEMMTVLGVAARRDSIRIQQRVVMESGLLPGRVAVPSIALANAWSLAHPDRVVHGSRSVLVHGGQSGVLFVVLDGGVPVASHYASLGMEYFAEEVRATNAMLTTGALEEALYREGDSVVPEPQFEQWFGKIAQEARRTAGAAPRMAGLFGGEEALGEVWLSGGMARVSRMRPALEWLLGARVHVFDPLVSLRMTPEVRSGAVFGPALAIAVGLAAEAALLEAGGGGMIHIDLRQPLAQGLRSAVRSPLTLLKGAVRDPVILTSVAAVAVATASVSLMEIRLARMEAAQHEAIVAVNQEYTREQEVIGRSGRLQAEREKLEGVVAEIRSLDHDRYAFVRLLDEVAAQIPENSWIDGLRTVAYNAESGSIEFHLQGFSPAVEVVSAFQRALEATGDVAGLRLTGTGSVQVGEVPVVRFELTGRAGTFAVPDPGYAEGVETVATSRI